MTTIKYKTKGVCSKEITCDIDNGIVTNVNFISGCNGNLQGISRLVKGMPVKDVITKLRGIDCRGKGTSCPDQLAQALESTIKKDDK